MKQIQMLAIDDDHRILRLVCRLGANCGFDVTSLNNPFKFESVFDELSPAVIVLDLVMQECDGMELIQVLARKKWEGSLILLSGMDPVILRMAEQLATHSGLKVAQALQKPFNVEDLVAVLHECHNQETGKAAASTGMEAMAVERSALL